MMVGSLHGQAARCGGRFISCWTCRMIGLVFGDFIVGHLLSQNLLVFSVILREEFPHLLPGGMSGCPHFWCISGAK